MSELAQVWELVLRGLAIGALGAIAAGLWRGGAQAGAARPAGALLALGVSAYALNSSPQLRAAMGPAEPLAHFLALGGGGLFWLFIVALFEDRPISAATLAPTAGLTLLGLVGWLGPRSAQPPIWVAHNLIEAGLAVHALVVIGRSWTGDLVEARRRLRGPLMALTAVYVLVLAGFEAAESLGVTASWYPLAGAAALATFCVAGAGAFLTARAGLFGTAEPAGAAAPGLDAADRHVLAGLARLMDEGQAWRREGLTIGALAGELGLAEHQLRRLINDRLGHRNFAAFVNARRIEAAKAALADPARARTPVSAIAFELGFGSLGPFNRAFKEATGATPSEWRRQALGAGAPNPENPG